jgi:hypothetical protein
MHGEEARAHNGQVYRRRIEELAAKAQEAARRFKEAATEAERTRALTELTELDMEMDLQLRLYQDEQLPDVKGFTRLPLLELPPPAEGPGDVREQRRPTSEGEAGGGAS